MAIDKRERRTTSKWVLGTSFLLAGLLITGLFLYIQFNRLLSHALTDSFNATLISDVYELHFERLEVNPVLGNMKVGAVSIRPRKVPLADYPYINSTISVNAEKIVFQNVRIAELLFRRRLIVENAFFIQPEINLELNGDRNIFFPFADSTNFKYNEGEETKRPIESFGLRRFAIENANVHLKNNTLQRYFAISAIFFSVDSLSVESGYENYLIHLARTSLSIGNLSGDLKTDPFSHIKLQHFSLTVDSLAGLYSLDSVLYRFKDLNLSLHDLNIQTKDSMYNIALSAFQASYLQKSLTIRGLSFKPNVSHASIQSTHQYKFTEFSGSIASLNFKSIAFDSFIYSKKIFIDEVIADTVRLFVFEDRRKQIDSSRFPKYPSQEILKLGIPLKIKKIAASGLIVEYRERKHDIPDGIVTFTDGKVIAKNFTNLDPLGMLKINASARLLGKVPFNAALDFSYRVPAFYYSCSFQAFNLVDLNTLLLAHTPAKFISGKADEVVYTINADEKSATGKMRFLYHDLNVDIHVKDNAHWINSILRFGANTAISSSNPPPGQPPKEVQFSYQRNMNKGFLNLIIKSSLNGLKETLVMSNENKKAYRATKRRAKRAAEPQNGSQLQK